MGAGADYRQHDWDRLPLSWVVIGASIAFAVLLAAGSHDKLIQEACRSIDDSCQPRPSHQQQCESAQNTWSNGQCWDQSQRRKPKGTK
jgi:hypothetical protein